MSVWVVHVFLHGAPAPVRLGFKSLEAAGKVAAQCKEVRGATVADEYGTTLCLTDFPLAVAMIDTAADSEINIELALLQQRGQIKAQKRAAHDPTLSNNSGLVAPQPIFPQRQ